MTLEYCLVYEGFSPVPYLAIHQSEAQQNGYEKHETKPGKHQRIILDYAAIYLEVIKVHPCLSSAILPRRILSSVQHKVWMCFNSFLCLCDKQLSIIIKQLE
jgi:hypothetical protein